jgi:hypothetical protein
MEAIDGGAARPRKLLVLDLNGFLIDRVRAGVPEPDNVECDIREGGCAVYYRPHMREFIEWCFTRFTVGVWTSAKARNVASVLDEVFGARRWDLHFEWDQSACTVAGLYHPDSASKPIFLKELSHLWR